MLGRFLSADSIVPEPGNPQAFNRYSYCLGNPLRYIDPTGHLPEASAWGEVVPTEPEKREDTPLDETWSNPVAFAGNMIKDTRKSWKLLWAIESTVSVNRRVRIVRSGGVVIVRGDASTARLVGVPVGKYDVTDPIVARYYDVPTAMKSAFSRWNLLIAVGPQLVGDTYQYGWGDKSHIGIGSTEHVATLVVDSGIGVVGAVGGAGAGALAGAFTGALGGTAIAPGVGTVAGLVGSLVLTTGMNEHVREPLIGAVDRGFQDVIADTRFPYRDFTSGHNFMYKNAY